MAYLTGCAMGEVFGDFPKRLSTINLVVMGPETMRPSSHPSHPRARMDPPMGAPGSTHYSSIGVLRTCPWFGPNRRLALSCPALPSSSHVRVLVWCWPTTQRGPRARKSGFWCGFSARRMSLWTDLAQMGARSDPLKQRTKCHCVTGADRTWRNEPRNVTGDTDVRRICGSSADRG
jgi:hypothetical protein